MDEEAEAYFDWDRELLVFDSDFERGRPWSHDNGEVQHAHNNGTVGGS